MIDFLVDLFKSFLFKKMGFPGGYGFAVCSYLQLIIMCYMGRNVQIAVGFQLKLS